MQARDSNQLSGMTVLIVEDEPLVAMSLSEDIEAAGGTVMGPVNTVASALRLLDGLAPHAAILDIELGGELVFPLADVLRARDVRFVFTTGFDARSLPLGYDQATVLEKPFASATLLAMLARLR